MLPKADFLAAATELYSAGAQLDAAGLPSKFRVLPYGQATISQAGQELPFVFTRQMAETIAATADRRGNWIPFDLHHALFILAEEMGLEETDALAEIPGEKPAVGYVKLAVEEDGLYAVAASWIPRAATLLKEKMYRYFSPVFRGLTDPANLRISSFALSNNPAFSHQQLLVAEAEKSTIKGSPQMNTFTVAILAVLGIKTDAIALEADGSASTKGQATILGAIEALKTRADANPDAVALQAENVVLKSAVEGHARQAVIDQGRADGKLTEAMIASPMVTAMDAAAMSAFLEPIPKHSMVPLGTPIAIAGLPAPATPDAATKQVQTFHSRLGLDKDGKLPVQAG